MATSIGFDVYARDRASKTFDHVGDSAERSSRRLAAVGKVGKFAALGLAAGVGVAAVAAVKLAKSAMSDQQAAALMAKQFRNSAGATTAQIAATEKWITAQGRSKGVADDDLRPALSKLVTATHDVGKAQRLASLAMDVSAGTGKDLGAVSMALMKAQNGNTAGLGRLGVATKDAAGHTKSFAAITRDLGTQFGGAAATKANTLSGKVGRLKLILSETGESIGYKLLPPLTSFATWILGTGIPLLGRFGDWFNTRVMPPLRQFGDFIQQRIVPAFSRFGSEGGKGSGMMRQFGMTVSTIFASVKSIFISTQQIVTVFWNRFGGMITTYAIGYLRNMLTIVRGVFTVLAGLFRTVAAVMRGDWSGAWKGILQIVRGVGLVIKGAVSQLWNGMKLIFRAGGSVLRALMSAAWSGIKAGAVSGAQALLGYLRRLPGYMKTAIGDLSSLLLGAGKDIVRGLVSGIKSLKGTVTDALQGLIPGPLKKFAHKLGIKSPSRVFAGFGRNIVEGLTGGILSKKHTVEKALELIGNMINRTGEKLSTLKDTKAGFLSTFSTDSLFNTQLPEPGQGNPLQAMLNAAANKRSMAVNLGADVRNLLKKGISKNLLAQMQSSGASGAAQIHALAGGTAAQIAWFNAQNQAANRSLQATGLLVGNSVRGGSINRDIRRTERELAIEKAIERGLKALPITIEVHLEGDTIVKSVKARNRRLGVKTAGL